MNKATNKDIEDIKIVLVNFFKSFYVARGVHQMSCAEYFRSMGLDDVADIIESWEANLKEPESDDIEDSEVDDDEEY